MSHWFGGAERRSPLLISLVLVALSILHWNAREWRNDPLRLPDHVGRVASFSFSPYSRDRNPERASYPTREELRRDMETVSRLTDTVRTYTVTEGLDEIPAIADELGMKVTLGIWLDDDEVRNSRELEAGIALAREHRSVVRVIVGNETILRREKSVEELGALLDRVRMETGKPVSTGEPWGFWLSNPGLVDHVDFMAAHVLPFWEQTSAEDAVSYALERVEWLGRAFPGKRIWIGEFGWPSGRYVSGPGVPSLANQAMVVRDFLGVAAERGIDYNLMEAFDQPWKVKEGNVGGYWGYFDAERLPKFPLSGPVIPDPDWRAKAAFGILISFAMSFPLLLRRRSRLLQKVAIVGVSQIAGAALAEAFATPFVTYVSPGLAVMWAFAVPFVLILLLLSFDRCREMIDVLWGPSPIRTPGVRGGVSVSESPSFSAPAGWEPPMVSVHLAACREPPEMLMATLDSLAALDWPRYEVIVALNNTDDASIVDPVRAHCDRLGSRFRFFHWPKVSGFKAGALNLALRETDPSAEVIALVDADYVVDQGWLRDLVPAFSDPRVALVQAPQANREAESTPLDRAMDAEYAGFFDVGMVQRNEDDAIIAHGTMLLLRREAMRRAGDWSEWCICEDTELGLRLFESGWKALYVAKRYGWGLLPDTLKAYRSQRHRWAYGAMRIAVRHWRSFIPWRKGLTSSCRFHFLTGWLHWVGDLASVAMSILNVFWVAVMAFLVVEPPNVVLSAITLAATVVAVLHTSVLYRVRVGSRVADVALAAVAGAGLQLTVARAVASGLTSSTLPFKRTAKGGSAREGWRTWLIPLLPEGLLFIGLLWASFMTWRMNWDSTPEMVLFSMVLAVQSLPYAAAFAMQWIASRSARMKDASVSS